MIFFLFMACRYEIERLKEKKIEKISKISRSLRKILLKAKQIQKLSLRKIFNIRLKSTPTTIKRESNQGGETRPQDPSSRGFIYSLSFLLSHQFLYSLFINAKVFSILLSFLLLSCIIHLYILLGVRRSGESNF